MFYDLSADSWQSEEREAVMEVVESGNLTMGSRVAEFEKTFAEFFSRQFAVMTNSGSSANLIGIAALSYRAHRPLERGDEVIVPAIAWSTTYAPLQQYGLKLRFVDVELDTLNMDTSRLEEALSPATRAVVGVSILGNPAGLDEIRAFADRNELIFFEDNCESMDAELNGRKTGTFGDIGTFSTFYSHHVSTVEGGMMLTDDLELAELARSMRAHGWTRDLTMGSPLYEPRSDDFYEKYRFILPGYNLRPQEINAAVGLVQLAKLPAMTETRRRNMAYFHEIFGEDDRFILQRENGKSSSFCFTIILDPAHRPDRARIIQALREADIGARIITGGCFPRHDVIKHYDFELVGEMSNANLAHDNGFFVGNHPFDLSQQIDGLYDVLDKTCG